MFTKSAGALVDGLNASGDVLDQWAVLPMAGGAQLPLGQVIMRDYSQLTNISTQGNQSTLPANVNANTPFVAASDVGALPNAGANVGDVLGVNQSPPTALAVGAFSTNRPTLLRKLGIGWVFAGVPAGGAALVVGALLVAAASSAYCVVGARAFGINVGRITAYPVNTQTTAAIPALGAQTVAVSSAIGINTSTVLTVDSGSFVEVVTPTAVSYGALATANITLAVVAAAAGTVISGLIGTVPYSYVTVAGDTTATIVASNVVKAINATVAVAGLSPIVLQTTNVAGVISINALAPGALGNAIALTAGSSTPAAYTAVASSATLLTGANPTITAVFAQAHALGASIQGITKTGNIVTAPATGYLAVPVVADINVLL